MSRLECVGRFHLCEPRKDPAGAVDRSFYAPSMLGVEISKMGGGWSASPVFAVELPPSQIRSHPISHIYTPADLSASHGRPQPTKDDVRIVPDPAPTDDVMSGARAAENAKRARLEHRERIRNAPFIE